MSIRIRNRSIVLSLAAVASILADHGFTMTSAGRAVHPALVNDMSVETALRACARERMARMIERRAAHLAA